MADYVAKRWQEAAPCPVCGAGVGEPCGETDGVRTWHADRVLAALADWHAEQAANKNSEEWVYGAEARAAALQNGRSDWQQVTGWPVHLERAHDEAAAAVVKAKLELRNAERAEIVALSALMATEAVQKRPLEPQPAEDPTKPHAYRGNRSMDTCWIGAPNICGKPLEDRIHIAPEEPEDA